MRTVSSLAGFTRGNEQDSGRRIAGTGGQIVRLLCLGGRRIVCRSIYFRKHSHESRNQDQVSIPLHGG